MKLSENQKQAIQWMRKYTKEMIMHNGWMTGGYGIKIKLNTVNSLERLGLVKQVKEIVLT